MKRRVEYKAYRLNGTHSSVVRTIRTIRSMGVIYPSPEQIASHYPYDIDEQDVITLIRGLLFRMEGGYEASYSEKYQTFVDKVCGKGYLIVLDQNHTDEIPAFATNETGMCILNEILRNPYRTRDAVAASCFVAPRTVEYHIRRASKLAKIKGLYPKFQLRDLINNGEVVFFKKGTYFG